MKTLTTFLGFTAAAFALGSPLMLAQQQEPQAATVVAKSSVWIDTVKRGDMPRAVRTTGTPLHANVAQIEIPIAQAKEIVIGQPVAIDTGRTGLLNGEVSRIFPIADGIAKFEIQAVKPLPAGAQELDILVHLEKLREVVYLARPANLDSTTLFKLAADGKHARKVTVRYGRASFNTVEIASGLEPGDQVIVSDSAAFASKDRIRLE